MPHGGILGHKHPRLTRWFVSLLFQWLYTREQQHGFAEVVREIAGDARIPDIQPTQKAGREYRRDEASIRAICGLCLKHSTANLGCELAYWLLKDKRCRK